MADEDWRHLWMLILLLWPAYCFHSSLGFQMPTFAEAVPNVTVTAGKDALLPCVVDNLGHFKVAWVRVDTQTILTIHTRVISRNPRISLTQTSHRQWYLRMKAVEPEDRGFYMCQVNTNPMRSSTGYLEVLVPPVITDRGLFNEIVAREGSNVTLSCKAKGHPEPKITWKKEDGTNFIHNGVTVSGVDDDILQLTKVSRLHMGAYLCIASNGVPPSVSQRVFLKVQFPPMLWIPNQLEAAHVGQEVVLECHIEAYPKSINYWTTAKGDMINSGDKYDVFSEDESYRVYMRLKIRFISAADFGTYKCVAKNSLGETDGSIKLHELPSPATTTSAAVFSNDLRTSSVRHTKDKARKKEKFITQTIMASINEIYDEDESESDYAVEDGNADTTSSPALLNYPSSASSKSHSGMAFIVFLLLVQSIS